MNNQRAMSEYVRPEMLKMGRLLRAKTQRELAVETGIDQALISKYENGHSIPEGDLGAIAQVLELPVVFFRRQIVEHAPNGASMLMFRRRQTATEKTKNQVLTEIRWLSYQVRVLLDSVDVQPIASMPLYEPKEDTQSEIEDIAERARLELRVPPGPVKSMTRVLESVGVAVFRRKIPSKIDALVASVRSSSTILLISNELLGGRQRFTLAHELGHMVMHSALHFGYEVIDRQADQFASAFLMPEHDIKSKLRNLTMERICALSAEWRVSVQAIVHRAHDLDTITERQARWWYEQLSRSGWRSAEPIEIPIEYPTLVDALIRLHMNDLCYSTSELAQALLMLEWEFRKLFLNETGVRVVQKANKPILRPFADGS